MTLPIMPEPISGDIGGKMTVGTSQTMIPFTTPIAYTPTNGDVGVAFNNTFIPLEVYGSDAFGGTGTGGYNNEELNYNGAFPLITGSVGLKEYQFPSRNVGYKDTTQQQYENPINISNLVLPDVYPFDQNVPGSDPRENIGGYGNLQGLNITTILDTPTDSNIPDDEKKDPNYVANPGLQIMSSSHLQFPAMTSNQNPTVSHTVTFESGIAPDSYKTIKIIETSATLTFEKIDDSSGKLRITTTDSGAKIIYNKNNTANTTFFVPYTNSGISINSSCNVQIIITNSSVYSQKITFIDGKTPESFTNNVIIKTPVEFSFCKNNDMSGLVYITPLDKRIPTTPVLYTDDGGITKKPYTSEIIVNKTTTLSFGLTTYSYDDESGVGYLWAYQEMSWEIKFIKTGPVSGTIFIAFKDKSKSIVYRIYPGTVDIPYTSSGIPIRNSNLNYFNIGFQTTDGKNTGNHYVTFIRYGDAHNNNTYYNGWAYFVHDSYTVYAPSSRGVYNVPFPEPKLKTNTSATGVGYSGTPFVPYKCSGFSGYSGHSGISGYPNSPLVSGNLLPRCYRYGYELSSRNFYTNEGYEVTAKYWENPGLPITVKIGKLTAEWTKSSKTLKLSTYTVDADIKFSTDDGKTYSLYASSIGISKTTTVKFFAEKTLLLSSDVFSTTISFLDADTAPNDFKTNFWSSLPEINSISTRKNALLFQKRADWYVSPDGTGDGKSPASPTNLNAVLNTNMDPWNRGFKALPLREVKWTLDYYNPANGIYFAQIHPGQGHYYNVINIIYGLNNDPMTTHYVMPIGWPPTNNIPVSKTSKMKFVMTDKDWNVISRVFNHVVFYKSIDIKIKWDKDKKQLTISSDFEENLMFLCDTKTYPETEYVNFINVTETTTYNLQAFTINALYNRHDYKTTVKTLPTIDPLAASFEQNMTLDIDGDTIYTYEDGGIAREYGDVIWCSEGTHVSSNVVQKSIQDPTWTNDFIDGWTLPSTCILRGGFNSSFTERNVSKYKTILKNGVDPTNKLKGPNAVVRGLNLHGSALTGLIEGFYIQPNVATKKDRDQAGYTSITHAIPGIAHGKWDYYEFGRGMTRARNCYFSIEALELENGVNQRAALVIGAFSGFVLDYSSSIGPSGSVECYNCTADIKVSMKDGVTYTPPNSNEVGGRIQINCYVFNNRVYNCAVNVDIESGNAADSQYDVLYWGQGGFPGSPSVSVDCLPVYRATNSVVNVKIRSGLGGWSSNIDRPSWNAGASSISMYYASMELYNSLANIDLKSGNGRSIYDSSNVGAPGGTLYDNSVLNCLLTSGVGRMTSANCGSFRVFNGSSIIARVTSGNSRPLPLYPDSTTSIAKIGLDRVINPKLIDLTTNCGGGSYKNVSYVQDPWALVTIFDKNNIKIQELGPHSTNLQNNARAGNRIRVNGDNGLTAELGGGAQGWYSGNGGNSTGVGIRGGRGGDGVPIAGYETPGVGGNGDPHGTNGVFAGRYWEGPNPQYP